MFLARNRSVVNLEIKKRNQRRSFVSKLCSTELFLCTRKVIMTKINITEANETSKFGEGLFNGAAEHEDVNYGDKLSRAVEKKC